MVIRFCICKSVFIDNNIPYSNIIFLSSFFCRTSVSQQPLPYRVHFLTSLVFVTMPICVPVVMTTKPPEGEIMPPIWTPDVHALLIINLTKILSLFHPLKVCCSTKKNQISYCYRNLLLDFDNSF